MRKTLFLILFAVLAISSVFGQTAVVTARPSQIDISTATSESAVLMTVSGYPSNDARYRVYNGGNQYNPWNTATSTYISSTSYSDGPQIPGTPTTTSTWWIPFQRGNNVTTVASYRDRLNPYSANHKTVALPAATAITTPVSITNANVTFTTWNTYTQKYVILAYDSAIGGNLISATSTALTTGAFDLKIQDGTTIQRIVVVDLLNNPIESVTGSWGAGSPTPTINVTGSLTPFSTYTGTPSASQSYTLGGSNLTTNIVVAIPTGYEISTDNSTWLSGLSLASTYNGPVYVRMTGTTAGTYDGNIVHSSTDASPVNTAVTGLVSDPNPEIITIGTLYPFQTMTGLPSPAQSYLITGAYLTNDITVNAPAGFNVSANGIDYSQFVSVPGNSTSAQVFVRLTGVAEGTFSGNVTNVSAPAPQIDLAATGVVSDLLFEENFAYTATDQLTSHGWNVTGTNTTPYLSVSEPGLSYTNYPSIDGNSVLFATAGQDVNHPISEQTTGSVYVSALVNVSAAQAAGDYFLHLGQSVIGTAFRGRVFVQKATDTEFKFGISFAGNETVASYTTANYLFGTTYLVVLKYMVVDGAGNDTAYLFVDPAFNVGEPAFTLQVPDTGTDLVGIGAVALRQGSSSKAAAVRVDGIRVANSWENLWGLQFSSSITLEGGPLDEFTSVVGIPSAAQQYAVRGTDLSTGVTITAPTGFEVSLDGDSGWETSLYLPPTDGSVFNDVYVHFLPTELLTYDGNISHTSGSATPQSIAVRGIATAPVGVITVNETPLTFNSVSGVPTDLQQISVVGSNLIAPIIVTVEAPFQIKKTTDIIWGLSAELASNFNGVIDVRFNPTIGGNFNGQVMFASTDATTKYTPLTGTAVQAVATIAELRSQTPGTSAKYALTGQGVITYIRSASRDQFYLQDATAAIVVDDINHLISNDLLIGDGIVNLTGTIALYNSLLQFTPTSEITAASSTGNPVVAETRTLASLTSADQAKLVLINNLSFTSSGTFAASQSYTVTDASGNGIVRTNFTFADGADYIGTAVPIVSQHLTALVGQFGTDIQITPRTLADFDPAASVPEPTKLVVTTINPTSPTVGQPFSVTIQAQDEAGTPVAVTSDTVINLSRATGTGTLSGTLSGTMNNLQNTLTITGVLYDTAQIGVSITATVGSGMALTAGTSSLFEVLPAGVEPVVAHYWNFNTNLPVSPANWAHPIPADMGTGGSLSYDFTTAVTYAGSTLNGVSGEVSGGSFCPTGGVSVVENNGHYYELSVPTTGYESIVFSYASRGTATGFSSQEVQYSTDGTNFQTMQTFTGTNVTTFSVKSVDFSGITGVNNNPNFKIRVIVSGATATSGNNRFDNIKVMGLAITGGTLDTPIVTISRDGTNVVLNWNAITGAAGGYRIEADTNPYGSFSETYTVAAGVLTWSQASAEKKFYRVVALP